MQVWATGSAAIGAAVDFKGNVALYRMYTFGFGPGLGGAGGLSFSAYPFAETIDEIEGFGGAVGAWAGLGVNFLSAEGNVSLQGDPLNSYVEDFRLGLTFSGIPFTGGGLAIGAYIEGSHTQFLGRTTIADIMKTVNGKSQEAKELLARIANELGLTDDEAVQLLRQLEVQAKQLQQIVEMENSRSNSGDNQDDEDPFSRFDASRRSLD